VVALWSVPSPDSAGQFLAVLTVRRIAVAGETRELFVGKTVLLAPAFELFALLFVSAGGDHRTRDPPRRVRWRQRIKKRYTTAVAQRFNEPGKVVTLPGMRAHTMTRGFPPLGLSPLDSGIVPTC